MGPPPSRFWRRFRRCAPKLKGWPSALVGPGSFALPLPLLEVRWGVQDVHALPHTHVFEYAGSPQEIASCNGSAGRYARSLNCGSEITPSRRGYSPCAADQLLVPHPHCKRIAIFLESDLMCRQSGSTPCRPGRRVRRRCQRRRSTDHASRKVRIGVDHQVAGVDLAAPHGGRHLGGVLELGRHFTWSGGTSAQWWSLALGSLRRWPRYFGGRGAAFRTWASFSSSRLGDSVCALIVGQSALGLPEVRAQHG